MIETKDEMERYIWALWTAELPAGQSISSVDFADAMDRIDVAATIKAINAGEWAAQHSQTMASERGT